MPKRSCNKTADDVAPLRIAMAMCQWSNADLAKKMNVSIRSVTNQFGNDWSSASMRGRAHKVFKEVDIEIFAEYAGREKPLKGGKRN